MTAGTLRWDHRDPVDRMIAAQSMLESIALVSADEALTAFAGVQTVW